MNAKTSKTETAPIVSVDLMGTDAAVLDNAPTPEMIRKALEKTVTVLPHAGLVEGVAGDYAYLPALTVSKKDHTPDEQVRLTGLNDATSTRRKRASEARRAAMVCKMGDTFEALHNAGQLF